MNDKLGIKNLTALLVDDSSIMRTLTKEVLTTLGFGRIITAQSAEEAKDIIIQQDIDFLICDWRMGGMSGVELTRYIRNMPLCNNTFLNIIMLTGNAELRNIIEARDSGVTEYLVKPFSVKDLCVKITEIIEKPRKFVISDTYKGPSRRRRNVAIPNGNERRSTQKMQSYNY